MSVHSVVASRQVGLAQPASLSGDANAYKVSTFCVQKGGGRTLFGRDVAPPTSAAFAVCASFRGYQCEPEVVHEPASNSRLFEFVRGRLRGVASLDKMRLFETETGACTLDFRTNS